jgi:hypothetical protein
MDKNAEESATTGGAHPQACLVLLQPVVGLSENPPTDIALPIGTRLGQHPADAQLKQADQLQ